MAHAVLDLGVAKPIASHRDELLGPEVDQVGDFARSHDNATGECQTVILQELMLFQATLEQNVRIVANNVWLALAVQRHDRSGAHVLDLVRAEQDSLTEKVPQDVISTDELHPPIESVKDVSFLGDKLLVGEWHANVLEQLLDARVGHLVVLGRDKDTSGGDQSHNLVL